MIAPRSISGLGLGLVASLGAVAAAAGSAEARPASTGFYTEAGLGATMFLGEGRDDAAIGPSMGLRVGFDLWSWLSVGIHLEASTHEATVPAPPEGEYVQMYRGFADGRLGFRVGAIAVFAEGGAGAAVVSSNILQLGGFLEPGERAALAFTGGGGAEYQLQNRHYAFGLSGSWWLIPGFDALQGADARIYLRYTY
jgi:hypothetical protein